jgi:ATP phosphoribosyltransferase
MASSLTLSDGITIALPKGRILSEALALLKKVGLDAERLMQDSRKLILDIPERRTRFLLLRNSDIPTYVEYGAADMGIVGKDVLQEQLKDVYEPLDLQFGACRLVVARPQDDSRPADAVSWSHIKVATKYMRLAEEHFSKKGLQVELIYLGGSVELAPLIGLSDYVVDLVQTGRTLLENGLVEVEEIMHSTARLVVNRASQKTKHEPIMHLVHHMRTYLS